MVWRTARSRLRQKKGTIEQLRQEPPAQSITLDIDEMGPIAAKSYPGQQAVQVTARPAERARQEIDYGRRGKGYAYGALDASTGQCWTQCYPRRSQDFFIEFLTWLDRQIPASITRIYTIMDNLDMHHCRNLLLFMIHHDRWEFVYQPKYAAYLNLIEPWWKVLRSLALKGRRFETWEEVVSAIEAATAYWNAQKHPFVWGRRRRHQPLRCPRPVTFKVKVLRI